MRKYYDQITRIAGNVVTVTASDVGYDELAVITTRMGSSLAQVIHLEGDQVSLQVFAGTQGVSTGDRVRFLGHAMQVPFSDDLLGRIFDGSGKPRDERPPVQAPPVEIGSPAVNPVKRLMPDQMVHTGIPMIDIFNSLVESQKLPIFSVAGEPYNPLLARVGLQANADIIILGGMGLRHDDYLTFRKTFEEGGVLGRTIMFIHTAADPVVECLLVPDQCLAVGEQFALQGKKVLVLLTDMTAFSDALKEIAIIMEQIPSNRGYPGDLYTQLARRYEKAVDFEGAGSMTLLACVTMPGDDVTHPVPDNTGYITEGQFYLRNGRIEPFGSLSRLKQQVNGKSRDDHRAIMNSCIQLYALCREAREKRDMGFEMSPWDQRLLQYGKLFEDRIMNLAVNIPLFEALDRCWDILAECFEPAETGIRRSIIEAHWPKKEQLASA
ncbi:MAG: V-type sodium ATPase subunit B [Planctomycetes bacterium ADurb.Bin126]|nr:MAG: V-type sodium ATPase subunit B [Planctomycetes bacterium ADurb.Bin126]HOD84116.1 V-type ATP synthase subunit B [Phycisphaerae bacterium]HQL73608.1 V-type ATP synthase subunit B [Phycisphaerae bacterium]